MNQKCKYTRCLWEVLRTEQFVFCLFPKCVEEPYPLEEAEDEQPIPYVPFWKPEKLSVINSD